MRTHIRLCVCHVAHQRTPVDSFLFLAPIPSSFFSLELHIIGPHKQRLPLVNSCVVTANIFVDLFKVRNTKLKYRSIKSTIKSSQSFLEYYTKFLQLVNNIRILKEDYYNNLINKITLSLQKVLIVRETKLQIYKNNISK